MNNTAGSVNRRDDGGSPRAAPWQLWLATPEAAERFDPAAQSFEDKRRFSRMSPDAARAEWATSRALLAHVAPVDLARSLSHSRDFAALALAPAGFRIGIDVEQVDARRNCIQLARFAFAPVEAAQMEALDVTARRERFYILWTLKEACIKTFGLRLLVGLRRCVFTFDGGRWQAQLPIAGRWEGLIYRPRPTLYLAATFGPSPAAWTQTEWPQPAAASWPLIARVIADG
jgi:4'-phosphopantetheinyl transferase